MVVSWAVLAPFIALVTTLIAMQAGVILTGAIRRRDYRLFEDKSRERCAREFPLPQIGPSAGEARQEALSPLVNAAHNAANAAQTAYHNAVVRSAGCLVIAFIAMVLGTVAEKNWPLIGWPLTDQSSVEHVLAWIDAIAISLVLILFLYARTAGPRWIASRAGAELLRQYQFFNVILPGACSPLHLDELKSQFEIETAAIKVRVRKGSITDIITRIERFWSERRSSIETRALVESDIAADALIIYLQRRVRRQLGWFADSKERLEHNSERRSIVLLMLYCIAVILAAVKLVFFLFHGYSPAYLLPLLLIVTGVSAAMTAYYVNQNSRSLIHRYNTQQRIIAGWLVTFNDRWNFANLPTLTIDAAAKNDMRARILRFEDLMLEELIDWIQITSHDAMELAP
jgi:hypothetical protein